MKWKTLEKDKPSHKDLVLCWNGNIVVPAIYYDNNSFKGFFFFTTYYHESAKTIYSKVRLQAKHEITDVIKWKIIDEPN